MSSCTYRVQTTKREVCLTRTKTQKPTSYCVVAFSSHSTPWGYTTADDNGEAVEHWADSYNLTLIHNAKLSKPFNSARWKRGYNPDLIFVPESIANMCGNSFMESIPHMQCRTICARENLVVVAHPKPSRRGPMCFMCLMFSLSGPCELLFLLCFIASWS